jgi:hypothetical protein
MADLPLNSDDALPTVIVDSTVPTITANVKAASTASVVGDKALVVALSPNSPVPTGTNKIGQTGVAQGSTTAGENGNLVQGAVTTAAPGYTTGQTSPLSLDVAGNLRTTGTITGNVTVVQPTGANLNVAVSNFPADTDAYAQNSTTLGQLGALVLAQKNTTGTSVSLQVDGGNNLLVVAGTGVGASVLANGMTAIYLVDSAADVAPLWTVQTAFGGLFSGTANAAKQGATIARTPTMFKTVSTAATGSTAVWTPAAGNKWRLLKYQIEITSNAAAASAGILVVTFLDVAAATNVSHSIWIPATTVATGPVGSGWNSGWVDFGGFGILAAAAATVLNVNLSAALTAGACRVNVCGTEE